ncbi:MAG: DUF1015 domain-containing protein [Oscillospiraceae bacterium]|nr:DUF1015 domain-containing protein [Oscillospiraceae bacterium]
MSGDVFVPADILLPVGVPIEKWGVIACDQYSSERDYWERVNINVNGAPSTLRMIIPEVYLGEQDEQRERDVLAAMEDYAARGVFKKYPDSFVYIERTLQGGSIRRGLVGAVDLEEYEFSRTDAAVLASEGTMRERLPIRIRLRRNARFETPHIMSFIDDVDETVIEPLTKKAHSLTLLYDSELMEGGGHIRGMQVSGSDADGVLAAMRSLHKKHRTLMVIGDGNHSLASAKVYWDELKQGLSEDERKRHPARKALLEVNNVYEQTILFEAIHRVVFNVSPAEFVSALERAFPKGGDYKFQWFSLGKSGGIGVTACCIGDALTQMRDFLDDYADRTGCLVDYIHGADTVRRLSNERDRVGLLLPSMEKSELFATVSQNGIFPKKSFSVGRATDKRYYLECREIRE